MTRRGRLGVAVALAVVYAVCFAISSVVLKRIDARGAVLHVAARWPLTANRR